MDYVRVDYSNGIYEYYKNDTLTFDGTYRSQFLMKTSYRYIRIRRLKELPKEKKIGILYRNK